MTHYYQRLLGGLLGFFVVGPLIAALGGAVLGLGAGTVELLLGAVIGAATGAWSAGRVARSAEESRRT